MPEGYNPQVADSVFIPQQSDTSVTGLFKQDSTVFQLADSIVEPVAGIQDSIAESVVPVILKLEIQINSNTILSDSPYSSVVGSNFNSNFLVQNPLSHLQFYLKKDSLQAISLHEGTKNSAITPVSRKVSHEDWLTGLGLIILFLFIWIRIFYGKFYSLLADSLTSYQISAKLYLEKNVLTRRVSMILDIVYFIVFAVFLYELILHFHILQTSRQAIVLYWTVLGILFLYSMIRLAILRLTGFLFYNGSIFSEYIHHTFIINKGLGILLFPVIITVVFIPPQLVIFVLVAGIAIYLLAFAFKITRAYKIIIRKDILLFYMIVYLCTLEILPLLLGYKVMKSLILNY